MHSQESYKNQIHSNNNFLTFTPNTFSQLSNIQSIGHTQTQVKELIKMQPHPHVSHLDLHVNSLRSCKATMERNQSSKCKRQKERHPKQG